MHRIAYIGACLALALAGCGEQASHPASAGSIATSPTRDDAIAAVATTAAAVADAAHVAPPSTLTARTTIDEKAIRVAYQTFDRSLDVIDGFVLAGTIKPGSATALAVQRAILTTKDALTAASAAQRAGQAPSYALALARAQEALASLRAALAR